jgi:hypothetical protein
MTKGRAKQSGDRPYCGGSSAFAFWAASALRPLNGVEGLSLSAKASGTLQYLATRAHGRMILALAWCVYWYLPGYLFPLIDHSEMQ